MPSNAAMTLRQLFRRHPAAVQVVENALGARFWDHLDFSLSDFGAVFGIPPGDLLDKVAALPAVPGDCAWESRPLCDLIDRLTVEHEEFRSGDLPRLRALLAPIPHASWSDRYALDLVKQEFEAFARDFLLHMEEEEQLAFPGLLMRDSQLRHRQAVGKGRRKEKMEIAGDWTLPTRADEDFGRMLVDLQEKLRLQKISPEAGPHFAAIRDAFDALEAKLARHARLETEVLYSRVARLEADAEGLIEPRMWRS